MIFWATEILENLNYLDRKPEKAKLLLFVSNVLRLIVYTTYKYQNVNS